MLSRNIMTEPNFNKSLRELSQKVGENVITVKDFDLEWFKSISLLARKAGDRKHKYKYKDIITAFDIETSILPGTDESILYLWQWHFGPNLAVMGRTWDDFLYLCNNLKNVLSNNRLCVYVHNLSYEFQFLKGIYDFKPEEVFVLKPRQILRCTMFDCIELRCSYLHSNMSLDRFLQNMGVEHPKIKDFDYEKIRYPWTNLGVDELEYGLNDVRGLVEAIMIECKQDGDNLYTIPLTSTGYIRRVCKKALKELPHTYISKLLPSYEVFQFLEWAMRGGNCHANRYYVGKIIAKVSSQDRSSSYIDVMINHKFPISPFRKVDSLQLDFNFIRDLIVERGKAVLLHVKFDFIAIKNKFWGCPYLSVSKCFMKNGMSDNGRVIQADFLETTLTDIDFQIILQEYYFDKICIIDAFYSNYGYLPEVLKDVLREYYAKKTKLKGIKDKEYFYLKSKALLNSMYGLAAQNPAKPEYFIENGEYFEANLTEEELLEKNKSRVIMPYQWGVWTTAWARWELEEALKVAGDKFVYCDTDCVKNVDKISLKKYNKKK